LRKKLLLLDKDGTLIQNIGRPPHLNEVVLLPGVPQALKRLRALDYSLVIVTNQAAIGRGEYTEEALRQQVKKIREMLWAEGAEIDRIYHCPHKPSDRCPCRKPLGGMLVQAIADAGYPLKKHCKMVGDNWTDIAAARAAGIKGYQIEQNSGGLFDLVEREVFK
jgi:D-glycero-D-manno-heptose 1,7-bisphosphate phosphatase